MDEPKAASRVIEELLQSPEARRLYRDGIWESLVEPNQNSDTLTKTKKEAESNEYRRLFGPRFANATFDNYMIYAGEEQQRALEICRNYAENIRSMFRQSRNNLILAGKSGTGKNHLAYAIGKAAHHAKMTITAKPFLHIMQEIKATYNTPGTSERYVLDTYSMKDLLILEEIGVSFNTDAEKVYLFDLLDGRYKYSKPTIIITNFSEQEFRQFVDFDGKERIWDRLRQTAVLVNCTWESYRTK